MHSTRSGCGGGSRSSRNDLNHTKSNPFRTGFDCISRFERNAADWKWRQHVVVFWLVNISDSQENHLWYLLLVTIEFHDWSATSYGLTQADLKEHALESDKNRRKQNETNVKRKADTRKRRLRNRRWMYSVQCAYICDHVLFCTAFSTNRHFPSETRNCNRTPTHQI